MHTNLRIMISMNEISNKNLRSLTSLLPFKVPTTKQQCVNFFGLLSLKLNNVTITATMPTSGYAPGQVIPLQIDVNNRSGRNISEFKIELNKVSLK